MSEKKPNKALACDKLYESIAEPEAIEFNDDTEENYFLREKMIRILKEVEDMSEIRRIFKGKYVLVDSIDDAIELTIGEPTGLLTSDVYSRSESIELLAELGRACESFDAVSCKEVDDE